MNLTTRLAVVLSYGANPNCPVSPAAALEHCARLVLDHHDRLEAAELGRRIDLRVIPGIPGIPSRS